MSFSYIFLYKVHSEVIIQVPVPEIVPQISGAMDASNNIN